jgi:hypothetical protein
MENEEPGRGNLKMLEQLTVRAIWLPLAYNVMHEPARLREMIHGQLARSMRSRVHGLEDTRYKSCSTAMCAQMCAFYIRHLSSRSLTDFRVT